MFLHFHSSGYYIFSTGENGNISLKLQHARPYTDTASHTRLLLYLNPRCSYKIIVTYSWLEVFGQVSLVLKINLLHLLLFYFMLKVLEIMSYEGLNFKIPSPLLSPASRIRRLMD